MAERNDDIKSLFEHLGLDPSEYREVRARKRPSSDAGRWSLIDELARSEIEPAQIPPERRAHAQGLSDSQRAERLRGLRETPLTPRRAETRARLEDLDAPATLAAASGPEPDTRAPERVESARAEAESAVENKSGTDADITAAMPPVAPAPAPDSAGDLAGGDETGLPRRTVDGDMDETAAPVVGEADDAQPADWSRAAPRPPQRRPLERDVDHETVERNEETPGTSARWEESPLMQAARGRRPDAGAGERGGRVVEERVDDFEDAIAEVARAAKAEVRKRVEAERARQSGRTVTPAGVETPAAGAPGREAPAAQESVTKRPAAAAEPPARQAPPQAPTASPSPERARPQRARVTEFPSRPKPIEGGALRTGKAPKLRFRGSRDEREPAAETARRGAGLRGTFERLRHPEKPPVRGNGRLRLRYGARPGVRHVQDAGSDTLDQIFARLKRRPRDPDE